MEIAPSVPPGQISWAKTSLSKGHRLLTRIASPSARSSKLPVA